MNNVEKNQDSLYIFAVRICPHPQTLTINYNGLTNSLGLD